MKTEVMQILRKKSIDMSHDDALILENSLSNDSLSKYYVKISQTLAVYYFNCSQQNPSQRNLMSALFFLNLSIDYAKDFSRSYAFFLDSFLTLYSQHILRTDWFGNEFHQKYFQHLKTALNMQSAPSDLEKLLLNLEQAVATLLVKSSNDSLTQNFLENLLQLYLESEHSVLIEAVVNVFLELKNFKKPFYGIFCQFLSVYQEFLPEYETYQLFTFLLNRFKDTNQIEFLLLFHQLMNQDVILTVVRKNDLLEPCVFQFIKWLDGKESIKLSELYILFKLLNLAVASQSAQVCKYLVSLYREGYSGLIAPELDGDLLTKEQLQYLNTIGMRIDPSGNSYRILPNAARVKQLQPHKKQRPVEESLHEILMRDLAKKSHLQWTLSLFHRPNSVHKEPSELHEFQDPKTKSFSL